MSPNPYESPQEAGYASPQPDPGPLWRRIAMGVVLVLATSYVGWLAIAVMLMMLDYLGWQFGI